MSINKMHFIVPVLEKISIRLDQILVQLIPGHSRTNIKKWILQGKVFVNQKKILLPKKKFFQKIIYILKII